MVQLDSNLTDGTTGQVSSRPGPLHLLHPDVIPPNAKIPMVGLRDWRNNFCFGPAQANLQEVWVSIPKEKFWLENQHENQHEIQI